MDFAVVGSLVGFEEDGLSSSYRCRASYRIRSSDQMFAGGIVTGSHGSSEAIKPMSEAKGTEASGSTIRNEPVTMVAAIKGPKVLVAKMRIALAKEPNS
ncbi:hypothetical protein ACLOJK_030582 [Asimina triloba]